MQLQRLTSTFKDTQLLQAMKPELTMTATIITHCMMTPKSLAGASL